MPPPPATASGLGSTTWSTNPYSSASGRGEPPVAVGVGVDLVDGLAGLLGDELGQHGLHVQDELGVDPHVGGGAADAARGLVHHHAGVRRRVALALGARREQELPHRGRHAHRHRGDVRLDVLHGVVDRHARGDRAAGRVDVQEDVLVRVLRGEQHHLRADGVGVLVAHLGAEPDDALAQQSVVDGVVEAEGRGVGPGHRRHVARSRRLLRLTAASLCPALRGDSPWTAGSRAAVTLTRGPGRAHVPLAGRFR